MATGSTAERDCYKEEFKRYKKKSTDFKEVLDVKNPEHYKLFKEIELSWSSPDSCRADHERLGLKPPSEWRILSLPCNPGLLLLPDLFQRGRQHQWVKQCLVEYPCKPNVCNLDAHIERVGQGRLWPENSSSSGDTACEPPQAKKIKTTAAKTDEPLKIAKDSLLYRLRWVTLGYHYDWDKKEYRSENRSPFPEDLGKLAAFILRCAGFPRFRAEAAIVNYYHLDSSLSGHTDHSEKDLNQPLLSISFGQSAVFLIGGKSKQIKPVPILLRSGDVVIMSGEARLSYHGVPRILPPPEGERVPASLCSSSLEEDLDGNFVDWQHFESYLSFSRININIRQVVSESYKF